ncbi:hypothetical protein F4780DRAFT_763466 [Xylariomycetidae sp. FL0641]|nr:hypothetical protein F4780DRAFT_763466 [Xylariomycetidae sp. FL0641]
MVVSDMSIHAPDALAGASPPRPSLPVDSETSRASSDVAASSFSPPSPPLSVELSDPRTSQEPVPNARNTRKLVIDSASASATTLPSVPASRASQSSIKRKPLPSTASPVATRFSSGEYLASIVKGLPTPDHRYDLCYSAGSPTVYEFPHPPGTAKSMLQPAAVVESTTKPPATSTDPDKGTSHEPAPAEQEPAVISGEVRHPSFRESNPAALQTSNSSESSHLDAESSYGDLLADDDEDPLSDNIFDGYNTDTSVDSSNRNTTNNMSLHVTTNRKAAPPQLNLNSDNLTLTRTDSNEVKTPDTNKPLPKSPGSSKLGNFFGWGASSPSATEQSDKGYSPLPSPFTFSKKTSLSDASPATTVGPQSLLEAPKAQHSSSNSRDYCESYLATPAGPLTPGDIEEMEDELKAISAELASSIRREMDLEDLVDRLQAEKENQATTGNNRRTSDYFSDSGYSSAKYSEYEQSRDEIEKVQRRSEQEKAQLRLELTNKLQDERDRRAKMDDQIKELSARASQLDQATVDGTDASDRVKELEATCETLRRKLNEEREVKNNFEDLLTALKDELQDASNERDNLRDEIVPQLRARVEGLEGQAADLEKMTYESTKMQQEMQSLKMENSSLRQGPPSGMGSISEEGGFSMAGSRLSRSNSVTGAGLTRSNSLTGAAPSFRQPRPPSLLSRSKTVKSSESRDQLSERIKDVEEQRDALHRALKNLLDRQEHQNRENEKKIRILEMERDRLLTESPQKAGFQRDITNLRAEISVLRRRAEEALDQKWQVEKGLGGLKMDLDRAEQEIASLRGLLGEKDILIPPALARASSGSNVSVTPVTSDSLTAAYADLQQAYAEALERIKNLESGSPQDDKTLLAMEKLETALSSAVADRDLARQEASSYQEQLEALRASEQAYIESEKALADELQEAARRVEELALQVRQQLEKNQVLRQRMADTVSRGEASQKTNAAQITGLQARLRSLEEKLEAAQSASEDRINRHEEEVANLKESHNQQLTRMRDGLRSPRLFPPKSPMSPLFAGSGARSPRLSSTRSGPAMSVSEESQVDNLRARVAELENALADAETEMQEVVGRMNTAQIEVLTLQEEREAAVSQTRKLERELQAERVKAFEDRFKTMQA